jgi:predicted ATP-dependent endonuclease of OLD family
LRISKLKIKNYRTIENLSLDFSSYYTALCGKNDAGKSNVIRALQSVFQIQSKFFFYRENSVSVKDDFTMWLERDTPLESRSIDFEFCLEITKADDEGLYRFLQDYLKLSDELLAKDRYQLRVGFTYVSKESTERIRVDLDGEVIEVHKAQEVWKRIYSAGGVLFHDSTEFFHPFRFRESADLFKDISVADRKSLETAQSNVNKVFAKLAKRNQQELTEMLGRLSEKYKIGVTIGKTETAEVPYTIGLSTLDGEVDLEKWGNGTQNRTRILMTLFKARRVREGSNSSEKITPLIVIEEPESYLHPSAQAEFGQTLRDLAEELKIQVIVTTHSPYLLSLTRPADNMLLERSIVKKRSRETKRVDTDGDRWAEPFSLALGINDAELAPWKDALFTSGDSVILVEGETDKEYLTLLQNADHGEDRLSFGGTIFAYDGKDSLKQRQLLKFIKSRFKTFIVTYDLDIESEVQPTLLSMGLVRGKDFIAIGRELVGKKAIEGLLPDAVFQSVWADNVELVQKATSATGNDSKSAKSALKKLYLTKFTETAKPQTESFKGLYGLSKQLNRMLKEKNSVNLT